MPTRPIDAVDPLREFSCETGHRWVALLMLAPVYLAFRTYRVFVGRLGDEQRRNADIQRLHGEALEALAQARAAEQALARESTPDRMEPVVECDQVHTRERDGQPAGSRCRRRDRDRGD